MNSEVLDWDQRYQCELTEFYTQSERQKEMDAGLSVNTYV